MHALNTEPVLRQCARLVEEHLWKSLI
jgi:hypothetical protein